VKYPSCFKGVLTNHKLSGIATMFIGVLFPFWAILSCTKCLLKNLIKEESEKKDKQKLTTTTKKGNQ
jgi:hypothetical protein